MFYRVDAESKYNFHSELKLVLPSRIISLSKYEKFTPLYNLILDFAREQKCSLGEAVMKNWDHERQPEAFSSSALFWDILIERVRIAKFPNLTSRLDSIFAYTTINDVEDYTKTCVIEAANLTPPEIYRLDDKVVYQLNGDIESDGRLFDATFIDLLSDAHTYQEAELIIGSYWNESRSPKPSCEVLLTGEIFVGSIVKRLGGESQ